MRIFYLSPSPALSSTKSAVTDDEILIFCDGACSGNPGPGGWGAVLQIPTGEVRELGGSSPSTTNNQMELTAAIEALAAIRAETGRVRIVTDSTYVIRGITQWIWGWKKKGWQTAAGVPVANRELWERLLAATQGRAASGKVEWAHVKGHAGHSGNERADRIAVAFSQRAPITLYRGPRSGYGVELRAPAATSPRSTGSSKGAAIAYLSLLDGRAMRHATWAECEKRVKGKSGAKYKKVASEAELADLLREWGTDLE